MSTRRTSALDIGITKKLSRTQADLVSLELTWGHFLPHAQPPNLCEACAWVRIADFSRILRLVEQVAGMPHVPQPKNWIFRKLRDEAGRRAR